MNSIDSILKNNSIRSLVFRSVFAFYNLANVIIFTKFQSDQLYLKYFIFVPVLLSFLDFGISPSVTRGIFLIHKILNISFIYILIVSLVLSLPIVYSKYNNSLLAIDFFFFLLSTQCNNLAILVRSDISNLKFILFNILRLSTLLFSFWVLFFFKNHEEYVFYFRIFSNFLISLFTYLHLKNYIFKFKFEDFGYTFKIYLVSLLAFLIENILRFDNADSNIKNIAFSVSFISVCSTISSLLFNSYFELLYPKFNIKHLFLVILIGGISSVGYLISSFVLNIDYSLITALVIMLIFIYKYSANFVSYDLKLGPYRLILGLIFSSLVSSVIILVHNDYLIAQLFGLLSFILFSKIIYTKYAHLYR